MIPFNVIFFEFNKQTPTVHNIMPYLINWYKSVSVSLRPNLKDFKSCKDWVDARLRNQYWSRCEYEFIMVHWPYKENNILDKAHKIDIYEQCKMNLDIITQIFIQNVYSNGKRKSRNLHE